jgi:hypothetical protein
MSVHVSNGSVNHISISAEVLPPLEKFIQYAIDNKLALLQLHPGKKRPVGDDWPIRWSADPLTWRLWASEGYNLGIHLGASKLICVDPDTIGGTGDPNAWANWANWCAANGLPEYPPHSVTASGSWHIFFRIQDGETAGTPREKIGSGVDILTGNKNAVAPGSYYDGSEGKRAGHYRFFNPDAPPPHEAPPELMDLFKRKPREAGPGTDDFDYTDIYARCAFLADSDNYLADEFNWVKSIWALRKAFGDRGWPLAEMVSYRDHKNRLGSVWEREDPNSENPSTCATLIDKSNNEGYREWVRAHMFDALSQPANDNPHPLVGPDTPGPQVAEEDEKLTQFAITDFVAYLPMNQFIYLATGQLWPGGGINSALGSIEIGTEEVKNPKGEIEIKPLKIRATDWLNRNAAVASLTWAPGRSTLMRDTIAAESGWIDAPGKVTFNQYIGPTIERRDGDASPWINHVHRVYPDDAAHIIAWCAHRVQHPERKINHGLLLGGSQGVGKDTILEPVTHAIGPWNFKEINPDQLLGQFNGFVKCVILRVNEARNLGDQTRVEFYEKTKTLTAAPPTVLHTNEKYLKEHYVSNVCAAVFTTNHMDGLFLPPDDRRFYVAWSNLQKEDFVPAYWTDLYTWFENGGNEIVAGYLAALDLNDFDAKGPPRKTPAWQRMANTSRAPEDAELADVIEKLGNPDAVTTEQVRSRAGISLLEYLRSPKYTRSVPRRFEACSYVAVDNPDAKSGLWRIGGTRQVVYAKQTLTESERVVAAKYLVMPLRVPPPPY